MKTIVLMLVLGLGVSMACLGISAAATAAELGLITGSENGAYYQFGVDLKRLVKPAGIELTVYPSKGSIDNLSALHSRPGVQMAIVQSDVLDFIAGAETSPLLTSIAKRLRVIFPLYNEEVHIIARNGIGELEQLAGRRVAVGPTGSGTYVTARWLFKLADVRPSELVPIDAAQALTRLKAGELDAMVYVAAAPLKLLRNELTEADGVRLIPVTHKSVLESYDAVELPANTYPWQPTPVATVAVKALLVTVDSEERVCDTISRFAQQVAGGLEGLTKRGHPNWQRVDLGYHRKDWKPSDCARKYLDAAGSVQASPSHPR
jgi:TRAP transporter TAXI family solute receptor